MKNYKIKRTCENCGFGYTISSKELVKNEWQPNYNRWTMYQYIYTKCTNCGGLQYFDIASREVNYEEESKYHVTVRLYRWLKSILARTN